MSTITELIEAGDRLFAKRENLLSFWQETANNFAPDLADFTSSQTLGTDYASNLVTSYPIIVARELCDSFGAMLRPSVKDAALMYVEGLEDHDGKAWLEWATKVQRKAMYDRAAQYVIAAKQGERDFSLFGQAVISVEAMPDKSSLLFRAWHLRDTAWSNGISGAVECVHRKWETPTAYELARIFGAEKLHPKVRECLQAGKDPYTEICVRHLVLPADMYHGEHKFRTPLVSVYIDVANEHMIEVTGQRINPYVIPRWQRIKGTQYAISPAVTCALPEARLLQAMTFTLLEAGEKATNPPMLATQDAIRGEVDLRSGGLTFVVADYDERMGQALRPLQIDKSGMPLGLELQQRSEEMLRKSFYADKLSLPQRGGPQETAYEVGQRVQQYIRDALPLVEPVEVELNGGVWERAFEVGRMEGMFGPPDSWPEALLGADIEFKFASPLREQVDRQKGTIFLEGVQLLQAGAALDPAVANIPDAVTAMRDVLEGIGFDTAWVRSPQAVQAASDAQAQQAQAQQMLAAMGQAAGIAKDIGASGLASGSAA